MEIRRGPKSTHAMTTTDEQSTANYADNWCPDKVLRFDGTIDKSGHRHTDLGIKFDEDDIIALHNGLVKYFKGCVKERDDMVDQIYSLEKALTIISPLASQNNKAPDDRSLLSAIKEIADHYSEQESRTKPYKSAFSRLKRRFP